jgi:lipoyl-dependent peroxiredoxin
MEVNMPVRKAEATWIGTLREGKGTIKFGSGAYEGAYSFASRFEEGPGTNPEELLGAAHAGCFSMALSSALVRAGYTPARISTQAEVTLGKIDEKNRITHIHLITKVSVSGISVDNFLAIAEATKEGCPVSTALKSVPITLDAILES